MPDWERELWEAHVGCWQSHYTIRDLDGKIVDEHDAINDIALDWERNLYVQRNIYTRGEAVEVRRYSAHWEGREMRIRGRVLEGRAWAADRRVILLHFSLTDKPVETFETIVLLNDVDRSRVMQHFVDRKLVRVTSVTGEIRLSAEPGIDLDCNDIDDRVPPGATGAV